LEGIAHPEVRSQGVLKIKAIIQEYRYLNVSLVIGGNVTAFQLYVSPEPLGRRDLHSVSAIRPWLRRFFIWLLGIAKAHLLGR
jgi:hypothetical protein